MIGPYVLDFACVALRFAVEVDGDSHYAHEREAEYDRRRDAFLVENGWTVVRVTNREVREEFEGVLRRVRTMADDLTLRARSPCGGAVREAD